VQRKQQRGLAVGSQQQLRTPCQSSRGAPGHCAGLLAALNDAPPVPLGPAPRRALALTCPAAHPRSRTIARTTHVRAQREVISNVWRILGASGLTREEVCRAILCLVPKPDRILCPLPECGAVSWQSMAVQAQSAASPFLNQWPRPAAAGHRPASRASRLSLTRLCMRRVGGMTGAGDSPPGGHPYAGEWVCGLGGGVSGGGAGLLQWVGKGHFSRP
jgi:hypothetical protein